MATHSRSAVGELVLGSVSEAVVRSAPVPVLLVGPHVGHDAGPFGRVVVALDGSVMAEQALVVAEDLAGRLSASLSLVEVLSEPLPPGNDVLESSYLQRTAASLGRGADFDTLHGPDPAEAILDWVGPPGGTMVAVATHGRTGLRRLLMGSVALDVVRHARCPVLVIGPGLAARSPSDDSGG